jgi:hypothetical protein
MQGQEEGGSAQDQGHSMQAEQEQFQGAVGANDQCRWLHGCLIGSMRRLQASERGACVRAGRLRASERGACVRAGRLRASVVLVCKRSTHVRAGAWVRVGACVRAGRLRASGALACERAGCRQRLSPAVRAPEPSVSFIPPW